MFKSYSIMSLILNKKINILTNNSTIPFAQHVLKDKFRIIENNVDEFSIDELTSMIDNYFENLLHSNEKVIHSDLLSQIFWFRKDFDTSQIIIKHLENYLKQKKIVIRNSIKKGSFDIDSGLNNLIKNYYEKVNMLSTHVADKDNIIKIGLTKLYDQIITDPSLISYLKTELGTLETTNQQSIMKFTTVVKKISEINPDIKSYQWFLFLISSSLKSIAEETNTKSYPVPENFQRIINIRDNLSFYQKVESYYSFVGIDITVILSSIVDIIFTTLCEIMKTCTVLELYSLVNSYSKIIDSILKYENIKHKSVSYRELFTTQFIMIMERYEKEKVKLSLEDLINCTTVVNNILSSSGKYRDTINSKVSAIFSSKESQEYLLNKINQRIIDSKDNEQIMNILCYCYNIKDKDVFVEKYNRMLVNRILNKPNIQLERNYLTVLQSKFGDKLLYKTNRIVSDMEFTLSDKENFVKLSDTIQKQNESYQNKIGNKVNITDVLKVVTSSYNNWDINQTEGIVTSDMVINSRDEYNLTNIMYVYSKFYESRYENKRKLNWYPHFGEIKFEYEEKDFIMLPIQFMILEHVQKIKSIKKEELTKFHLLNGYNDQFKKSIIGSLLVGGIFKLEGDNLIINPDEKVTTDYVSLFFSSTNYAEAWNTRREKELVMAREDVLSSWVNHLVKKAPVDIDTLFTGIKEGMTIFEFDKTFLTDVINKMIEKDYIKYNEDKLEKILW